MGYVERIALATFGLVALYVFLNAHNAGYVIGQIGQNTGGLFGVLQGGNVNFPDVQITRPAQF
jgi:hypothetical protein